MNETPRKKELPRWNRFKDVVSKIWYVLFCAVVGLLIVVWGMVLWRVVSEPWGRWRLNRFELYGFAAFFVFLAITSAFRKLKLSGTIYSNLRWAVRYTHEITHALFAFLFFRKIHRLNVDSRNSHVLYDNGSLGYLSITLSPYCVPIFTLMMLPWRFTVPDTGFKLKLFLLVIDTLIGFTYAFHVWCWCRQTRHYQTDITGPGTVRSFLCIAFVQKVNLSLILLTPRAGVANALYRVLIEYPGQVLAMLK